jgi:hypothetical protein
MRLQVSERFNRISQNGRKLTIAFKDINDEPKITDPLGFGLGTRIEYDTREYGKEAEYPIYFDSNGISYDDNSIYDICFENVDGIVDIVVCGSSPGAAYEGTNCQECNDMLADPACTVVASDNICDNEFNWVDLNLEPLEPGPCKVRCT